MPPGHAVPARVTGAPGAGKSTLAAALAASYDGVVVPLDGFHLADVELVRRGLRDRKGAPETFDADGYAALLPRIRSRPDHVVWRRCSSAASSSRWPARSPVPARDRPGGDRGQLPAARRRRWPDARAQLDVVWHVVVDDAVRVRRLVARHVGSASPRPARAWVDRVDAANAVLVEAARDRADVVLDLSAWAPPT